MVVNETKLLREAFQALLAGDTEKRDRICTFLERRHRVRGRTAAEIEMSATIELEQRPDGTYAPKAHKRSN